MEEDVRRGEGGEMVILNSAGLQFLICEIELDQMFISVSLNLTF